MSDLAAKQNKSGNEELKEISAFNSAKYINVIVDIFPANNP